MNKYFLSLIFICFSSLIVVSQNTVTDTTATVIGYWEKGNKIRLSITQTKEKYEGGELKSKGSSTSTIDVSIIDATEKSYTIKWKYVDIKLPESTSSTFLDKLSKMTTGLEVIYKTDEMGLFTELVNWKEIQSFIFKALDIIRAEYNDPTSNAAFTEVKRIYSSKETIEQVAIKEVQLYHSLYGGEYKLKEKISADIQLPNPLGGEPFPAFLEIEMKSLIPSRNTCLITLDQRLDEEKTTKLILDWVSKLAKKGEASPKIPNISIFDNTEFEVELQTGWVSKIKSVRTATAEENKQVQTVEIKLLN